MSEEAKPKYSSTQAELYAILGLAVNNLDEDLDLFSEKSTNYDAAFVQEMRDLITAAEALPDEEQRNGVHQNLKGLLPGLVEPIKQEFRDLQEYIRKGWPNENPKARYEQAGLVNYNKIGESNWEYVKGLNKNMSDFVAVAENVTLLTNPGGMVPTFVPGIATKYTAFKEKYDLFLSSKETGTARAAKINADNAAYTACMLFMTFGVESIMRNNAEGQKRYIFKALKDVVSTPGGSSLEVKAKKPDDSFATSGTVKIKKEGVAAILAQITAEGVAPFPNLEPGKYDGEVIVDGVTTTFTKVVETGTNARITVELP